MGFGGLIGLLVVLIMSWLSLYAQVPLYCVDDRRCLILLCTATSPTDYSAQYEFLTSLFFVSSTYH